MANIDRQLQLSILKQHKEVYPESLLLNDIAEKDNPALQANLFYLAGHGLIEPIAFRDVAGPRTVFNSRITSTGLDFLENDGGLSAIFNTVTVRFEVENIRMILEDKIVSSKISQKEKEGLMKKLKSFSAEALKSIVLKTIEKGIEDPKKIIDLIQSAI